MDALSVIEKAAESLRRAQQRQALARQALAPLRKNGIQAPPKGLCEGFLARRLPPCRLSCTVGGVDSGYSGEDLFAFNLVMVRAVGVVFVYEGGRLAGTRYHPGYYTLPTPHHASLALQREDFLAQKSLLRLQGEVAAAVDLLASGAPGYLLLDGSLVPQHADKPRTGSQLAGLYRETLQHFERLYAAAEEKGCVLVGCVEDSHNTRLRALLAEALGGQAPDPACLEACSDPLLLDGLLEPGERSPAFTYTENPKAHPILRDLDPVWARRLHACYLKPAPLDRPLRIEFFFSGKDITPHADKVGALVHALSSGHREYAYPAPLIEADLRAALRPEEKQLVYDKILDKLGPQRPLRMRRHSRPFS